jgi:tetratricopeptide (TPR) repeat protein
MTLLLISCAGGSKTAKEEKAVKKAASVEEHFQMAFTAAERGNLDEAVTEYEQVLKLDSKNAKAHLNLGIVYGRQGKWKKEISEYEKAIRIDPNFAEAHFNLGVAHQGRGNLKESTLE